MVLRMERLNEIAPFLLGEYIDETKNTKVAADAAAGTGNRHPDATNADWIASGPVNSR